jgi:hypothetical protein
VGAQLLVNEEGGCGLLTGGISGQRQIWYRVTAGQVMKPWLGTR